VILHELVAGERPQGVFDLPGKKDPGLPPLLDRTLAGALALDPKERFEDAGALLKFLRVGLWNDGLALRATQAGLRDRWVIAGEYGLAWLATLFFLGMVSMNEMRRDLPTALAIVTALLAAACPILVALPSLRAWNARLTKRSARIDRQLATLRGWREPDAVKLVEALAPEVKEGPRRRGLLERLVRLIRAGIIHWGRRRRRRPPST
jgi:hypothetical protein